MRSKLFLVIAGISLLVAAQQAMAQKKYGPGVSDTEIKLGQTMPYSGAASQLSLLGKTELAYFKMINSQGGVNGRKINLISVDDGFSPPKSAEQARNLVERDGVFAIFSNIGSGPNLAMQKYLNDNKVPHIFISAGTPKLVEDPKSTPWTTTFYPTLTMEGQLLAAYVLKAKPDAKVGIFYQNDETGKTYRDGFVSGLGDKAASMVVKEVAADLTSPTVESQILQLKAAGADAVFFGSTTPKFGAQGIRKIGELGWKPLLLLVPGVAQIEGTLKPAGLEYAKGAVVPIFLKYPSDPQWAKDPDMIAYLAFMKEYLPNEGVNESSTLVGYTVSQMLVEVLKRCGDDLTRENLMDKVTSYRDYQPGLFVPGVKVNISKDDRVPWRAAQIAQFDGQNWVYSGGIVTVPKQAPQR
jgi:ABC-type branched-subunit amino acid transport system substrate-binding protein